MKKMPHKYHLCGLILLLLVIASCVGQDPCEHVTCDNVCRGEELWEQKCIGGECVDSRLIERESRQCGYKDPCENVYCTEGCYGYDQWKMKCVNGECVLDYIIEKDSEQCGYVPLVTETPQPPPDTDHDGVPDVDDDCFNPGCTLVDENGCPKDSDGDGLADCYDDCPGEAGEKTNKGCPVDMPGFIGWEGNIPIIDWQYADHYYGQEVIIQGTIVDTYNSGKACFLNFHKDWKQHFSAVIFAEDFYKFPKNPEAYYLGKKVRIRGIVEEYEGKPEIIVEYPSQIEIIG